MFKKKKYTVIRQAISKDLASFVANYFLMQKQVYDTCKQARYFSPFENIIGHYEGKDEQIPETYSQYSNICLLYTSPSPRDRTRSRMPSSA